MLLNSKKSRILTLFYWALCWIGEHSLDLVAAGSLLLCSMTTSEAHEGQLLHMLQDPRHSNSHHCYIGCPIYREQSAIAMKPWAQPAGQYMKNIQKVLTLPAQYTGTITDIDAHTKLLTVDHIDQSETKHYPKGHTRQLLKMLLTSIKILMFA